MTDSTLPCGSWSARLARWSWRVRPARLPYVAPSTSNVHLSVTPNVLALLVRVPDWSMLDFPCQTSIPLETKKGNLNLSTTISWSIWITSVELPLLPTMEVLPHTSRTRNAIVDSVSFAPELSSFPDAVEMNTSGTRTNDDNPMAPTPTMVVGKAEAMNATWRATMEDRCVIHGAGEWGAPDQDMAFFGVYDGHGGRDMVDFLEHGLSFHVAQELAVPDVDIEQQLVRAFLMTDIHAKHAGIAASGATVALCLVKRYPTEPYRFDIITANVGDSRVVLHHAGDVIRLSQDHRITDPLEVARIEQSGGFIFKGRVLGVLTLTRSLGDQLLKRFVIAHPHVRKEQIHVSASERDTFIILACDGLFDVLSDQEAASLVKSFPGDKADAATCLVQEALRRGTTDNVSAIVVWL